MVGPLFLVRLRFLLLATGISFLGRSGILAKSGFRKAMDFQPPFTGEVFTRGSAPSGAVQCDGPGVPRAARTRA
jgi:hypothetical protein